MKIYTKEQWSSNPQLRDWSYKEAVTDRGCRCGDEKNQIELIDHSSCIIGRIDTTICTTCNEVVSFDIVR
jgi:hypothetical protein